MLYDRDYIIKTAARFRKNPTHSEQVAIMQLQKRGNKYYEFQKPFGFYILDFLIPSKALVVEIDGDYHNDRIKQDIKRDKFCNECGLRVLRVHNDDAQDILKFIDQYNDMQNSEYHVRKAFAISKERVENAVLFFKENAHNYLNQAKPSKPKKKK